MTEDEHPAEHEVVDRFAGSISDVIDYYRMEYRISYAAAIGALELCKADLIREAADVGGDDDHAEHQ